MDEVEAVVVKVVVVVAVGAAVEVREGGPRGEGMLTRRIWDGEGEADADPRGREIEE